MLPQAVCSIFNNLIDHLADSPIGMEHIHHALRPPPRDSEPPRDVACCIVNFPLKEEILCKAREKGCILFNGIEIKLFQDLSQITLQNTCTSRPLLDALCFMLSQHPDGSFRFVYLPPPEVTLHSSPHRKTFIHSAINSNFLNGTISRLNRENQSLSALRPRLKDSAPDGVDCILLRPTTDFHIERYPDAVPGCPRLLVGTTKRFKHIILPVSAIMNCSWF